MNKLFEINKSAVIIGRVKRTDNLSRIKKESAEVAFGAASQTPCLGSRLLSCPRMTGKVLSFLRLRGAGKKQKKSSLILRKAKFQAIFEFVLSSASGGAGGGKYNRISAFVSMPDLLIRRSREKFFKKNFRDDSFSFLASPKDSLHRHPERSEGSIKNDIKDWILHFANAPFRMTIPVLAFLLSLNLSTAFAEDSCECNLDGDTLTIKNCSDREISPSSCDDLKKATEVTIGTGVTYIGDDAFYNASSLTSITIPDSVTWIGSSAFANAIHLTNITIPEKVTYIGSYAFMNATGLKSITIPDNINTKNWGYVFEHLPENTKIVCQGDLNTCYEKLAKYIPIDKGGSCTSYCISPDRIIKATDPSQCSGNYGWSGAGCSRKNPDGSVPCASGFVEWEKECLSEYPFAKKRWTPAEANEWLHDGNDNFVVITFKK